jgi:hypothetical protein
VGVPLTVAFDVIDEADGFRTAAAIDNVTLTSVPEPGTVVVLGSTFAALLVWHRGRRRVGV